MSRIMLFWYSKSYFDIRIESENRILLGHEKFSMAILPLQLIQEEQLSVAGERMCSKYW